MMADMGYGLLMMIASVIISKKYRPKGTSGELFSLLGLCGISTFIMGALTGGFSAISSRSSSPSSAPARSSRCRSSSTRSTI